MQNSPTHPKKRRWACYARVSTSEQKTGLEAQIRALRTYCEQNGVTDFELFADENQSGSKASRPSLDRMMAAVEAGEIETCVVFAFSRFARSVSHMLKGLEVMKKRGTNFVSITEKIDLNTSLGNVVFILISAIAQLERDLISERVRNGLVNARAKGRQIGRRKTRNSVLIRSLIDAGLSYREISRISRSSHGSIGAEKKLYMAEKKQAEDDKLRAELAAHEAALADPTAASATQAPATPQISFYTHDSARTPSAS